MANFVVTTNYDVVNAADGITSLREAINFADAAAGADTITFDAGLSGQTIFLGGTQLVLSRDVTIDGDINGDNVADITISGNDASRVFNATGGTSTLHVLTITGGYTIENGGGLYVASGAEVTLTNSTLSRNSANFGGAISNQFGATTTLTNSTLSGNSAVIFGGGGITNGGGSTTLTNSIVVGNSAATNPEIEVFSGTFTATTSLTSGTAADVFAALDGNGGGLLADNGGPVQTIALNSDVTNPALDAGDDTAAPITDAVGSLRLDLTTAANNGANVSDLGAVELAGEAASLIVTIASDTVDGYDGETSLREALAFANSDADASTITFDAALTGQTITLGGTELVLSTDVTIDGDIDGDNAADITISGNDASRVFNATGGTSTLHALTITDGSAGSGGGIYIDTGATVALTNSTISDSSAYFGGGLWNRGTATLTSSTISGNTATYQGGGIYNRYGGTATLTNSTLSGNEATHYDGGGMINRGTATLTNTTISGNSASGPYGYGGDFRTVA